MSEWEPTMNLRIVRQLVRHSNNGRVYAEVRVLQQQWVRTVFGGWGREDQEHEWRDVPEVDDEQ